MRVFLKLAYSSEFVGSNSEKDLIFLRAQTHATRRSNKPFYLRAVVSAGKQPIKLGILFYSKHQITWLFLLRNQGRLDNQVVFCSLSVFCGLVALLSSIVTCCILC